MNKNTYDNRHNLSYNSNMKVRSTADMIPYNYFKIIKPKHATEPTSGDKSWLAFTHLRYRSISSKKVYAQTRQHMTSA